MDLYVPDGVGATPGVVVALHYCGGNAGATHSWFQSLADQYKFIIISPNAGTNCWDASPGRTGAKAAIVKMVQYVGTQNHADMSRVFAAGASSGACMTQTLLASYPDVFAAGSSLAGVPVGQWPSGNTSCSGVCNQPNQCSLPYSTAQQWGDQVRNADPGFTGPRPRVQLWHGTADTTLTYACESPVEIEQWTNVFGVGTSDATMQNNTPKSPWTRTSYTQSGTVVVESNIGQGVVHDLTGSGLFPDVVRFFGLDRGPSDAGAGSTGGTTGAGTTGTRGTTGTTGRDAGAGTSTSTTGTTGMSGATGTSGTTGTSGARTTGSTGNANTTGGFGRATASTGAGTTSTSGGDATSTSGGEATGNTAGSTSAAGATTASSATAGNTETTGAGSESASSTASNANASPDSSSSGCSCRLAGRGERGGTAVSLSVVALGMLLRGRRRARRRVD
jgi:poly(hydroxyalkanoate) depolymerase family esterase